MALARKNRLLASKATAGNHREADANANAFRARLTSLSERDRKILSLYCEGVLTLREIGKILHIHENAVGVYKSRAVETLRRDISGGRLRNKAKRKRRTNGRRSS